MNKISLEVARKLALRIVLGHYRREELYTKDCPELISGIAKVAGMSPLIVRDFFAIYIIPIALCTRFGWTSATTNVSGVKLPLETQEQIAFSALVYHMRTNGFRINARLRRSIRQWAEETHCAPADVESLFVYYLIPEAVKACLKIDQWSIEVHASREPETGTIPSDDEVRESSEVGEGL